MPRPSSARYHAASSPGYAEALRRIKACQREGDRGKILELQSLNLARLPPEIGQLTALTGLSLGENQFASLPPEIGQLTALTYLNLYNNQLTSLPPEIGQLTALTRLYLHNNQLTSLPPEIGQLTALTELHLYKNQLTSLPPEIGQLTALTELRLGKNQLTSLPPELGDLKRLIRLSLFSNPLPPELARLVDTANPDLLLAYLRGLSATKKPRRFDEAKLLFVGPGNVGKTWLLKALQGETPRDTPSTKGLEIARVPLDLPHPTEAERKLLLNCWDFGGQDYYQITHQIFFSAKAIYLLIWKPRTGVDPDLIERLERIQLSSGRTARVMIVSTHAEGNVPAVIGKDALKERFGDLIAGFYETDSARGPDGTGIQALKDAIAQAAAGLEGMDTPFPQSWHEARTTICHHDKPTMPFAAFTALCAEHQMDRAAAEALAVIMDVQGKAVYFANAASTNEDSGVDAEDNLIVLDPEWLAKAIGFVIEDKPTQRASGVLSHARLKQIWKKDTKRTCPGYPARLHSYLLWLMWKFDIAYRQSEHSSLVPELIHRNRPDDLRWTPTQPPYGHREARVICQMEKDPPVGLIPALTAAVHPLRRPDPESTHDVLDRNWRTGFFLDTARRGEAFVELDDRSLWLVVRDQYPFNLTKKIQLTLGELVKQRWPNLLIDPRIPCLTANCKHTFLQEGVEAQRGHTVFCERCKKYLSADELLEGLDQHQAEVMRGLEELKQGQTELLAGQRELMASSLGLFRQLLDPARAELVRAPCMISVLPHQAKSWDVVGRLAHDHYCITCWCEHPDGPHPGAPIGSDEAPDYVLTMPKAWLKQAAPYIGWASTYFKAFLPMVGNIVQQGLDAAGALDPQAKLHLTLLGDAAKALPTGSKLEIETRYDGVGDHGERSGATRLHSRPQIEALRHIHDALLEQVSKTKQWGGLRPVSTKTGEILWLCAEHAAIQQPPPIADLNAGESTARASKKKSRS